MILRNENYSHKSYRFTPTREVLSIELSVMMDTVSSILLFSIVAARQTWL